MSASEYPGLSELKAASFNWLLQDAYARRKAMIIVAALALSALAPFLGPRIPAAATGAVLLAVVMAMLLILRPGVFDDGDAAASRPAGERLGAALLLYLSPVLFLNVVYPLVSPAMAAVSVAGVPLTLVVLASSVTVPWLAQAACLPVYRVLGDLLAERQSDALVCRFFQFWPVILVQSLPLVVLFAIPLWMGTRWPAMAVLHYAALCVLHLVFVQSLVLANVGNRRGLWAIAWAGYAAALLLAPTVWWLPPLLGTATQMAAMRSGWRHLDATQRVDIRLFGADLLRGLLMGAVLWADKFVLFVVTGGQFDVVAVFAAMLPAVIAYNFYFVHLAPNIDGALRDLHADIAKAPLTALRSSSMQLVRLVDRSVVLTGAIAALLTLAVSLVLSAVLPVERFLAVSVATASWAFMMLTLLSYELDFIGEKRTPQVLGAVHLAACAAAFAAGRLADTAVGHAGSYLLMGGVDFLLIGAAWLLYKHHWNQPEYTLFWRHATSW